jgi:hypothetical protein
LKKTRKNKKYTDFARFAAEFAYRAEEKVLR